MPARFDRAASTPSDRCFQLQTAALNRELPKIPASLRQPTREIQAALIAYLRTSVSKAPRDTICFVAVIGNSTNSGCGTSPEAIKAGGAGQDDNGTYSDVVPDGVATVTLIFPATAGHPVRSVTASVTGNVYAIHVNQSPKYAYSHPPTVIWRSAEGRVIKRIPSPNLSPHARADFCKQEPIPCLLLDTATTQTSSASGSATAPARTR